ncbi:Response regulator receiver modulated diguanylate cyclase [Hyella patelloides LEGE 07179]|uniref:Response regulator receiver modulated diguanylate cyclase n=1 Tax=Hyella patelloides LEGE 07179 TaxID=945734 RepID=A0A563VQJ0_9CYAN|nr:diguanylate cyclase [Hyella patelloides]VEP13649.1 Response regulator receiver modulated diguanylate cyclase [Hyella patelloides LEGE 07179]
MNTDIVKILLIEDEIADADWLDEILVEQDHPTVEIEHVKRLKEAVVSLSQNNFDAILLDLSLPDSKGLEGIAKIKEKAPNTAIIVLTYLNDQNIAIEALRQGVQDYLIKGKITRELLIRSILYAIERQKAEVKVRQDALMKEMLDRIRQSLDLKEILDSTVVEIRRFLATDRVLFYRCEANSTGEIIAESIKPKEEQDLSTQSMMNSIDFFELHSLLAQSDNIQAIEDVIAAPHEDVYFLAEHQIRSVLTLAIWRSSIVTESLDASNYLYNEIEENFLPANLVSTDNYRENTEINRSCSSKITDSEITNSEKQNSTRLWGMLVAHNFQTPRKWQDWEFDFLEKLTIQITIAIQQSELYRKLQDVNQQLEKLAILDGLTGVANRRYFDRILHNEWQRLAREQKPLSLILCDIDYFKLYNDTYGHPAGDRCLQAVAKVLKTSTKRPADLVARYGGEEFAIILPDTNTQGALFVANEIRRNLAQLKLVHKKSAISQHITLSIGITTQIPLPKASPHHLIAQTDNLLYQAKRQGRDCIAINDPNQTT